MEFNTACNVIPEEDFKKGLRTVFNQVASMLTKTLGPYGTTTIIEQLGEHHVTKDGFTVLKNIDYRDPTLKNFLMLLLRISGQVVVQVGDGSTSSIVAADEIIKAFDADKTFIEKFRPRDLLDIINKCVDTISAKLYANATRIDTDSDNMWNEIYRIAHISTNGDDDVAKMIADIIDKTKNPTIEFVESKTDTTSYEIIDGYTSNICYFDTVFATRDDGMCVIDGANVLMFDYKIDMEKDLPLISQAAVLSARENKRLVVVAPAYDRYLLERIRRDITMELKARGTSVCVYCRVPLINNMSHVMYNDFAVLCGAQVINERYDDDAIKIEDIQDYMGYVAHAEINGKSTLIRGFEKRDDAMYEKCLLDATMKHNELATKYRDMGIIDTDLTEAKNRLTKLRCSMGVIKVGGKSSLERKSRYDLVEDAVRATESAVKYGYNVGGNLAIVYTIYNILSDTPDLSDDEVKIYTMISDAFTNVFKRVLNNKYADDNTVDGVIGRVMNEYKDSGEQVGYDLITDSFSNDIINSCRTDIEILRGAFSVISLLITSNQYIAINAYAQQNK